MADLVGLFLAQLRVTERSALGDALAIGFAILFVLVLIGWRLWTRRGR